MEERNCHYTHISDIAQAMDIPEIFIKEYIHAAEMEDGRDFKYDKESLFLSETGLLMLARAVRPQKYQQLAELLIKPYKDAYNLVVKTIQELQKLDISIRMDVHTPQITEAATDNKNEESHKAEENPGKYKSKNLLYMPAEGHVGEKRSMNNGEEAEVIQWFNNKDVTVRFTDKTVRVHVDYSAFRQGKLSNLKQEDDKDVLKTLFGFDISKRKFIGPDRKLYPTQKALSEKFNVLPESARAGIAANHVTFEEYIGSCKRYGKRQQNKGKAEEQIKVSPIILTKSLNPNHKYRYGEADAIKMYEKDSLELPMLSKDELKWATEVYNIMHTGALKKRPDNEIRKTIYTKMRDNYGIVLEQSLKDYKYTHHLNDIHIPYFRVVTQTPQLASIFKCLLEDWSDELDMELLSAKA